MKTLFINGSPKKHLSSSGIFLSNLRFLTRGKKVTFSLRRAADHEKILKELPDTDVVVFSMPLYVDGVPSHVLEFLKKMEAFCRENHLSLNVYVIANSGFIEGKQNETLMRIMENFCTRSGLNWCGGVGIGGGVMLMVMHYVVVITLLVYCAELVLSGLIDHIWPVEDFLISCSEEILVYALLKCGVFLFLFLQSIAVNRRKAVKNRYTRIMLPSFLFILIADVFFFIESLFRGGLFRGWLKAKTENQQ